MRFCFIITLGSLLAGVLPAADAPAQFKRTSVVHADPRTGKLVRSVVVTPRAISERTVAATVIAPRVVPAVADLTPAPEPAAGIDQAVEQIAAQHKLPAELLHSVIKVESNYNPHAVSPKGALGLMQLIPATARRFGVADVFNPVENIEGGARYLRYLLDLYGWDFRLALAAYNAGEAAVAKFGGVPPYTETRNYIVSVGRELEKNRAASAPKPQVAPVKAAAPRDPAAPNPIREVVETDGTIRYVSR